MVKNHPEMINWSIEEQYYYIHEAGGFVVHAHPFRKRAYIKEIRLFPDFVDAVEAYNVGNDSSDFDKKAAAYARKHNLPEFAGTDSHGFEQKYNAMGFEKPLNNIEDFISSVKSREYQLITDF